MFFNLINISKSYLKSNLLNKASVFLDEKNDLVKNTVDFILPTIFGGIIQKCENKEDALEIYNHIKYSSFNAINNFDEIFRGNNSLVFDESHHLLKEIFEKRNLIIQSISKSTKLHKDSVNGLLKMILPIVVKTIGNEIKNENLTPEQFSGLLYSHRTYIAKSVTAEYMQIMINDFNLFTLDLNYNPNSFLNNSNKEKRNKKIKDFSFATLLLVFVILSYSYITKKNLFTKSFKESKREHITSNISNSQTVEANTINDASLLFNPNESVLKKYIKGYEFLGYFKNRALKDDSVILIASNGGFNKLLNHIENNKPISKQAWFDILGIAVDKGKSSIDVEKSKIALDNLAHILNTYNNISLKVGSGTDNVGSSTDNFIKSDKIALSAMNELIKRGISKKRLRFEGYGENYPTFDNNSSKKTLNNRVFVRLTQK